MQDKFNKILEGHLKKEGNVISLLQDIQEEFGYIPEDSVRWFSKKLEISESRFFGVVTFYSQFHLKPRGKNILSVCCGTACHVKGGSKIAERVQRDLGLGKEKETTEDGKFTFEVVRCVGACSIAPVVIVNNKVYADMTADSTSKLIKKIEDEKSGAKKR